jgi:hypothetical protein
MKLVRPSLSRLVVLVTAMLMCGASLAFATSAVGPTAGAEYSNGVSSGVGKTSVDIYVSRSGRRVTAALSCFERGNVQVVADIGTFSYALHDGTFTIDKVYEVDKLVSYGGETGDLVGHGRVLLTARFTNGEFGGRAQIHFAADNPNPRSGKGCRASSYKAPIKVQD